MTTITIRRRAYAVEETGTTAFNGRTYLLTGPRGAAFLTVRQQTRRDRLAVLGSPNNRTLDGVILTDTDGPLRVVSE